MPKITFILPVYKVEKYLARVKDALLSQTLTDFEAIFVDDGSPDASGAICDAFAKEDSRLRVIHKKNGGVASARNAALDIASGDYIFFLDQTISSNRTLPKRLFRLRTGKTLTLSYSAAGTTSMTTTARFFPQASFIRRLSAHFAANRSRNSSAR